MIQPATSTNCNTAVPTVSEQDMLAHMQDDLPKPKRRRQRNNPLVNAIRDGKLVYLRWSQLTPAEKREAYNVMFSPDGF